MLILEDLLYTEEDLWVKVEGGNLAEIGLSDFGQERLGRIDSLDLPDEGDELARADECGAIQHPKGMESLYAPLTGKILEVNAALLEDPGLIGEDPYERGWILRMEFIQPEELQELMSPDAYAEFVEEQRMESEDELEEDVEDYDE